MFTNDWIYDASGFRFRFETYKISSAFLLLHGMYTLLVASQFSQVNWPVARELRINRTPDAIVTETPIFEIVKMVAVKAVIKP